MSDNEIIKLLHLLGRDVLKCRKDILRLTRTVQGYERSYQELPQETESPPRIIIPEEVYNEICFIMECEYIDFMGIT